MKNWTTDDNLKAKIDDWITIAESDRQRQLKNVDDQLTVLYDAVQEDIIRKAADAKEEAVQQWNDMNWFEKWWNGGSEEAYVRKAMTNYQNNVVSPVSGEIDNSFKTLEVEGSSWANGTMSDILDALFDVELMSDVTITRYKTSIENAIETSGKKEIAHKIYSVSVNRELPVGTLISFNIGEDFRVAILSVPEGDDKVEKYPLMFATTDALVMNKYDMKQYFEFDDSRVERNTTDLNPNAKVFRVSTRTGEGEEAFMNWLSEKIRNKISQ
jgi:hypothetical protein